MSVASGSAGTRVVGPIGRWAGQRSRGWKIAPFRGMDDFMHIDTGGHDASPDGGIGQRQGQDHAIVNYIGVESVDKYLKKVQKLGGKVCMPKTAVPQMGYFAVCQDSENNGFGLWELDRNAK